MKNEKWWPSELSGGHFLFLFCPENRWIEFYQILKFSSSFFEFFKMRHSAPRPCADDIRRSLGYHFVIGYPFWWMKIWRGEIRLILKNTEWFKVKCGPIGSKWAKTLSSKGTESWTPAGVLHFTFHLFQKILLFFGEIGFYLYFCSQKCRLIWNKENGYCCYCHYWQLL